MKTAFDFVGAAVLALILPLPCGMNACAAEPAPQGNDKAALGSPDFYPSPARPIGWRGDGTGHYPGATPPTSWSRTETGEKTNIVWETKLPCYSWATPIIVGERIYVRSDPYDLICLDKKDGKILWIRSHGPQMVIPAEERQANPAFGEADPLVAKLKEVNDAYVAQGSSPALLKQKHDLQHQINDIIKKADRKYRLPPDMWVESWSGYTGGTPCSDGKFIYFVSGSGVTACYDLDGNVKWAKFYSCADWWGEHGDPTSPALIGGKLLRQGPMALDGATGKEVWCVPLVNSRGGGYAVVPFKVGNQDFAVAGNQFIRVSDGKSLCNTQIFVATTPVANGNEAYFIAATYRTCGYRCELQGADGLKVTELKPVELPGPADPAKKWEPTADFYTAAPLYNDGLLYVVGNWGKFSVTDMQKGERLYTMQPPFDFKNGFHRKTYGTGIGAGLVMAGKYIYLTDNAGCTLVIEPGREYKQIAKNNLAYKHPKNWEGWERGHWEGPRYEVTLSTPIFEGNRMYVRGEQNLYCIGEK
ncbi:MAG: PQQ-binding-like beta-propeller repeat protein [Planctomycetota bacterium]|nr:PQQ-binding-like beta-propeller repeat protein [Planctomycetota bacterium]